LLQLSARILPLLAAFGLISKVVVFFGKVLLGPLFSIIKFVKEVRFLAPALKALVAQFAAPVAIVAALVAVFVLLYKNSEIFRESIGKLISAIGGAFTNAFGAIKTALSETGVSLSGMNDILRKVGDFIGTYIVPILQVTFVGAINFLGDSIAFVIRLFKGFFQILTGNPIEGLKTILGGLGTFIVNTFKNIWNNVKNALSNIPIFNSLFAGAEAIFKKIATLWNNTIGKIKFTTPSWVPGFGGKGFAFPTINLAEGGIIPPTPGGTIARIGEAGRAERVEPLDPDGLSKRDKAMIQMLSDGRGSGINITINPSAGMDERELASIVSRQIAFQLRKGAA